MGDQGKDMIGSPSDLSARLGEEFVLVVGSAISGVAPPYLSMDIARPFMKTVGTAFSAQAYADRLYAKYCELLAEADGSYKALIENEIKFEEFLWLLSRYSSREALDELLRLLYFCRDREYGPNHVAIAQLLKTGRCLACFTTNFDNAIETACAALGVPLRPPFTTPGEYPATLPGKGEKPILVKLHGSVLDRNCVADSAALLGARSNRTHGMIRSLLKGRNVLVVGYSGLGDIDISPQLSETDARFFWANHRLPHPDERPDWADVIAISDLRYPQNSGERNLLFDLAEWRPSANECFEGRREVDQILSRWLADTPLDSRGLLRAVFAWRRSNALAHLDHTDRLDLDDVAACRRLGWGYIQHRAYKRADLVFERGLKLATAMDENRAHLFLGAAFALWRLGRWNDARMTLYPLVRNDIPELANANETFREIFADACRVYLEVSRDLLQFLPHRRRSVTAAEWDLAPISCRLRSLLDDLPNGSAQDLLLARLVIRNIEWLTGKQMHFDDVQSEFSASMHSKYPTVAWAGIAHLLQMSFSDGVRSWRMLHRRLKDAHRSDYLAKNYETLLV